LLEAKKSYNSKIQERIEKIDSRPKWLKSIFGPDLTSINQVKKHLDQIQLRIQQLEQLKNQLTNAGEQQMVQELINALYSTTNCFKRLSHQRRTILLSWVNCSPLLSQA